MALVISIRQASYGQIDAKKEPIRQWFQTSSHPLWLKNYLGKWISILTVLWGLMSAILKTSSNDSSNGLQITSVLGSTELSLGWLIYSFVLEMVFSLVSPNFVSSSSRGAFTLLVGFRVSKHIIPSKQSSNPSLLRALAVWALSAFEKIYTRRPYIIMRRKLHCYATPQSPTPFKVQYWKKETHNFPNRQAKQKTPQYRVRF